MALESEGAGARFLAGCVVASSDSRFRLAASLAAAAVASPCTADSLFSTCEGSQAQGQAAMQAISPRDNQPGQEAELTA